MWWVEPDFNTEQDPLYAVIHLDMIIHTADMIGETDGPLSTAITYIPALDMFNSFYINKYVDHHTYEIAF